MAWRDIQVGPADFGSDRPIVRIVKSEGDDAAIELPVAKQVHGISYRVGAKTGAAAAAPVPDDAVGFAAVVADIAAKPRVVISRVIRGECTECSRPAVCVGEGEIEIDLVRGERVHAST